MATPSLAQPALVSTGYVDKVRQLFEERFEEFRYLGRGRWLLPSATTDGRHYEVSTRKEGFCECIGYGYHGHCCHMVAADLARLKSSTCDGCGGRFLNRHMVEVTEDHLEWTLSFFGGEMFCRECAFDHGVL